MSENIDQLLERLLKPGAAGDKAPPHDRSADLLIAAMTSGKTAEPAKKGAGRGAVKLAPGQITSAVHIIAPAQIPHVAELMANDMAVALNMRAMLPKIQKIAEESLRAALGAAKKQGAAPKV
ncbi:MAG: hypothetical protein FWG39_03065 [Alphaproteobacteria bacterium]|nr:hypothetical protein [Alphaproteobacteria bacterium]